VAAAISLMARRSGDDDSGPWTGLGEVNGLFHGLYETSHSDWTLRRSPQLPYSFSFLFFLYSLGKRRLEPLYNS
jgi:hypothetical protein